MRKVVRDVSRKAAEDTLGPGTAPLGKFWDPAGFTKGLSPNELKKYREAEITHGRVSMLGVLGFLTQEAFHPLFGGNIDGPAIKQFDEITRMAPTFWYPVLLAIAVAELGRARLGWQDPTSGGAMFSLRDEYEPGNIGFDPLNLKPSNPTDLASIKNKELNNGRLAMLALAGFVAQELVNGKPILG
uniref:Chloroplast protein LI8183 n=2 Tax=Bigelowiella natans TaxID=227086 RepID=A4QPI7_BIGNA|nr:TPA_inf: chloroplast protein precursor LI818;3 [Bigelowiella natans]